jgi:hypothetical protein
MLQEDLQDTSVQLLRRISQQLETAQTSEGNAYLNPLPPTGFTAPTSAVAVNTLWFLALILSLVSALFAIFLKQWLRAYTSWAEVTPAQSAVALRQVYHKAFEQWKVPTLRVWVQALLQIALVLYLVGLLRFLWTLHHVVFGVSVAAVGTSLGRCLLSRSRQYHTDAPGSPL